MTRRNHGTGSLRHLAGDRYRYQIRADGRLLSRVFTAKNQTEANRLSGGIRLELLETHERTKTAAGAEREIRQAWTVERYTEHYLSAWAPYHLADTTRQRYAGIFEHNVTPHIGQKRMAEVTPSDLAALYATLGSKKARQRGGDGALSGATIATVHSVVRALFTFAVDVEGDFPTNPAASRAARPKVDRTPPPRKSLSIEEVERFVGLARGENPEIATAVMLSAYLGTRRGETVALRWSDIDFDAGTITVRRSVSKTADYGTRVKSTKTGKLRTIPLDPHTRAELKRIQAEQRKTRLAFGKGWRGAETASEDYITAGPDGAPLMPDRFGSVFRALCKSKRQGIPAGITPHLLRHAWVSQMIALGFDAVTIAAMSGHSPDVLLRVYAHAFDARKREAMEALGAARSAARAAN